MKDDSEMEVVWKSMQDKYSEMEVLYKSVKDG